MTNKILTTLDEVIAEIGGPKQAEARQIVADLVGVRSHTLSSWIIRGKFPCATYKAMIDELPDGIEADPALWGMIASKGKGIGRRRTPKAQAAPEHRAV